jgi:hypothetical protein
MDRKHAYAIMSLIACLLLVVPAVESAQVHRTQGQLPIIDAHVHAFDFHLGDHAQKDSRGNLVHVDHEKLLKICMRDSENITL